MGNGCTRATPSSIVSIACACVIVQNCRETKLPKIQFAIPLSDTLLEEDCGSRTFFFYFMLRTIFMWALGRYISEVKSIIRMIKREILAGMKDETTYRLN